MRYNSIRDALRTALLFAALAAASACGSEAPTPPPDALPDLGDEKIRATLYDAWVEEVPEATNAARPISWHFMRDEPTEVAIVEKQMDGKKATVLVDVTARSSPRSRNQKVLAGRLRLHYELRTELIVRKWRIVDVDNISMTYRDEPRPDAPPLPGTEPADGDGPPAPPPPPGPR